MHMKLKKNKLHQRNVKLNEWLSDRNEYSFKRIETTAECMKNKTL